jgi:tetratricopeptide (TPR) repeat protein
VFHHTLAETLRAAGRRTAALAPYRRAAELDPERLDNYLDWATALADAGRSERALAVYASLAERDPSPPIARLRMATLRYERGELTAAFDLLHAWEAERPTGFEAQLLLAEAWTTVGEPARAIALFRTMRQSQGQSQDNIARLHSQLGSVLQTQGDFDEAQASFERALAIDPGQGWIHAALMANRGYQPSADRRQTMQRLIDVPETDDENRAYLHFALGQWHDRQAESAEAFAHFERGNRIHARREPFNPAEFDDRLDRIVRYFNADRFEQQAGAGLESDKPLFVVGMPRSGTSLVEQILASHPAVHGGGEMEDLRRMVTELPAVAPKWRAFPECLDAVSDAHANDFARRYLASLDARAPGAARVVDKMPFNLLWLGWVARMFPNARVVFCRREPMDNCLSCYFQIFSAGLRFTYDLAHLGQVYRQHERLMAHWADCLPLPILTVDYESMVSDPEPEIRRLIDFAGLPWDGRCLEFHRTDRSVQTASLWQVRQPVYRSSVARWQAYQPWLGELRTSLAPSGDVSGDV